VTWRSWLLSKSVSGQSKATDLPQHTRIPHAQNDLVSDASRLLDLGDVAVDRVELGSFGARVAHVVTADDPRADSEAWPP